MRRTLAVLLLALIAGCGQATVENPEAAHAAPPHGGQVFPMPESKGYVEIKNEFKAKGKNQSTISVYFLAADGKSALSPAPSAPTLKINGEDGGRTVTLQAAGDGFATPPGDYGSRSGLSGEVGATAGGQPVTVPFEIR